MTRAPLSYVPYAELAGRPNVIVDGSAAEGTVLCLSHWPGTPTPADLRADLSAQMAFRYLRSFDRHGDARLVSNNHFDQDGLVSVFALADPAAALAHEDLLTDVAAAGDFGTYRFRDAARASMIIAAYADEARSPLREALAGSADPSGLLYRTMLPMLLEVAAAPERHEDLWAEEDACLTDSERCVVDEVGLEEVPELDLAVFVVPEGAPDAGGHRFGGRWSAGLHPMAVHNATRRGALLIARGRRYELVYRYESWVQVWSRPVRPRVDLAPLARRLDELEARGATWEADAPSGLTAGVRLAGGAESSLDLQAFRALAEEHLGTAPPAWDPFPSDDHAPTPA
ncbi:MAG: hypothetical protein JNK12_10590 [Acidimicrobiales bacterium]|nr:hypothetical protein [Acidimicrobiales bacterium]